MVLAVARGRDSIDSDTEAHLVGALTEVPARAADVLNHDERLKELAGEIAEAHDTTPAAIAVAWVLHKPNGIAIPKTAKADRLAGNLAAAEITLTAEEIGRIDGLSRRDGRIVSPEGLAPEWD